MRFGKVLPSLCFAGLLVLTGCQSSSPEDAAIDWVELLETPGQKVVVRQEGFVPEAFTGETLEFRQTPSALELLEFHNFKNAAHLAGAKGLWPRVPLSSGISIPDPRYPLRKLLGWEFEPRHVIVGEANALILRSPKGTRVVPLDPDKPIRFPEDGSPDQRRARNTFLRGFDRDHRSLDTPRPDPGVEP